MEELESGQHEMQKKIAQMTKMVIDLTKGKGITNDPSLQRKLISWKSNIDPPIVSNLNNHGEQEELRKNLSGQWEHVDMQQRYGLLDKRLKEIEGVDDLGSVDPRELCLVPDLVVPPQFKILKFEKYDGTKCP